MSAKQNKKRGYEFEHEVQLGLQLQLGDFNVYKIPDSYLLKMQTGLSVPADFIISQDGKICTIEAKTTKLHRIPFANFKQHQIDWVKENPNSAYFVVNFRNKKAKINKTFLVTSIEWSKFEKDFKASVPMDAFSHELERKTKRFHPTEAGAYIDFNEVKW